MEHRTKQEPLDPPMYEVDVVAGLAYIVAGEIARIAGVTSVQSAYPREDNVRFSFSGEPRDLLNLKGAQAVYCLLQMRVPRPKAMLGDQQFRTLCQSVVSVVSLHQPGTFRTLGIAAAGSNTSVMRRLREELAKAVGLVPVADKGDLMLRLRPSAQSGGWDVLIRLSPRPLATRSWRIHNFEAALNATVAYAMVTLSEPRADDTYVNVCCGSGTLLVERLQLMPVRAAIGFDRDMKVLGMADAHLRTARLRSRAHLWQGDATHTPLPSAYATALTADLPFGQNTGSHMQNWEFYPSVLKEAARIARPGARFALLTHEIRLMESLIPHPAWELLDCLRITLRGLHPRIYLFERA